MFGQPAAGQGTIRRHGDVLLPAEGGHLPLLLPEDQVVVALHRDEPGKALFFRQGVCLAQLPGEAVGDADIPGLALLHHLIQTVHDVIEGRLVVPHVVDIQVHVVHPQVLQAPLQQPADVLLSGDARHNLLIGAGEKFGGHHHLVPLGKVPESPAQILLAGAALVADGGVEEVDPQLQAAPDDLPGVSLVKRPAVLAVGGVSKAHAAHADAGHIQI